MMISLEEAAKRLRKAERVVILCHQYPDGDTLGAGTALCRGLRSLGKRAAVRCSDAIGPKYRYLFDGLTADSFEPDLVVSADVADEGLLGEPLFSQYGGKIDLCIDHHASNTGFGKFRYVDPKSAATCEIIFALLKLLGAPIDPATAACLYTGISTDTGCFKYVNTTPATHRIAAELLELGAPANDIDRAMFDTKSRARLDMERRVLGSIRFDCGGRVAVIRITKQMIRESGAAEDDLDGLSTIPREIEGVLIGVTLREKDDGAYKVSLRAHPPANAAAICEKFGGGGHKGAAGCTLNLPADEAEEQMLSAIRTYLKAEPWTAC